MTIRRIRHKQLPLLLKLRQTLPFYITTLYHYRKLHPLHCLYITTRCRIQGSVKSRYQQFSANLCTHQMNSSLNAIKRFHPRPLPNPNSFSCSSTLHALNRMVHFIICTSSHTNAAHQRIHTVQWGCELHIPKNKSKLFSFSSCTWKHYQ